MIFSAVKRESIGIIHPSRRRRQMKDRTILRRYKGHALFFHEARSLQRFDSYFFFHIFYCAISLPFIPRFMMWRVLSRVLSCNPAPAHSAAYIRYFFQFVTGSVFSMLNIVHIYIFTFAPLVLHLFLYYIYVLTLCQPDFFVIFYIFLHITRCIYAIFPIFVGTMFYICNFYICTFRV